MNPRSVLRVAGLLAMLYSGLAGAFALITEREARTAQRAPPASPASPEPGAEIVRRSLDVNAPLIRMNQPDVSKPIRSPVDIEMVFEVRPDAQIVPDSFRARYLFLDLTERIRKHATIDRSGIRAPRAELPKGSFRIVFEIADTLRRVGRLEVTVDVE